MFTKYLTGENNESALAALAMQEAFKQPRDDQAMKLLYDTVDHDSLIKGLIFLSNCIAPIVTRDETPHRLYSLFRTLLNEAAPLATYEEDLLTLMEASLSEDETVFELALCSVSDKVTAIAALCSANSYFLMSSPSGDLTVSTFEAIRSTLIEDYLNENF
jgi:hypothetical protein